MSATTNTRTVRVRCPLEHARGILRSACWRATTTGDTVVVAGPDFEAFATVTAEHGLLRTIELTVVELTPAERDWADWYAECIDAQASEGGAQ